MTKEIRSPNVQLLRVMRSPVLSFGFGHSFGFRHLSFGFMAMHVTPPDAVCAALGREKTRLATRCGVRCIALFGFENHGSWAAPFRFFGKDSDHERTKPVKPPGYDTFSRVKRAVIFAVTFPSQELRRDFRFFSAFAWPMIWQCPPHTGHNFRAAPPTRRI